MFGLNPVSRPINLNGSQFHVLAADLELREGELKLETNELANSHAFVQFKHTHLVQRTSMRQGTFDCTRVFLHKRKYKPV